jgi:hypothetical protein
MKAADDTHGQDRGETAEQDHQKAADYTCAAVLLIFVAE